jgi:predicted lipoprotein with Yx(FWY)xxD motif
MQKTRTVAMLATGLGLLGLFLAGCGATSGGLYGGGGSSSTPTAAPTGSAAVVKTATATVMGQSETILTDSKGDTLYYYKSDTATSSACTGSCLSDWPPLLSSGGAPTSPSSLPGKLAVLSDANGMQVTYNGHPLYTFIGDTAPGMVSGEGVNNFSVATTNLAVLTGTGGGAPTPTSGGYRYGY